MALIPHSQTNQLRDALNRCEKFVQPWSGVFFRATGIEYANRKDLLTGQGAKISGGRWNPPGLFRAVYGSLAPETAMAEALANYRDYDIPVFEAMPLAFVAIEVALQRVLDLASSRVQVALGCTHAQFFRTNWRADSKDKVETLTQAIGRIAFEAKLEAILVPSARVRNAVNIVLFPTRRQRGSSCRISRVRKLPPPE